MFFPFSRRFASHICLCFSCSGLEWFNSFHTCASSPPIPDLSPAFRSSLHQFIVNICSRSLSFLRFRLATITSFVPEPHRSAKYAHLLLTAKLICPATCWILWILSNGWKEALALPCYYLSLSIEPVLMIFFLSSYLSVNNSYLTT